VNEVQNDCNQEAQSDDATSDLKREEVLSNWISGWFWWFFVRLMVRLGWLWSIVRRRRVVSVGRGWWMVSVRGRWWMVTMRRGWWMIPFVVWWMGKVWWVGNIFARLGSHSRLAVLSIVHGLRLILLVVSWFPAASAVMMIAVVMLIIVVAAVLSAVVFSSLAFDRRKNNHQQHQEQHARENYESHVV